MSWPGWSRTAYAVVVAVLVVSAQLQVWGGPSDGRGGRLAEALLVAGATMPLVVLRRWPLTVLLAVLGCGIGLWLVGSPLGQPWFALLLALYALGNRAGTRAATLGGAAVAALVAEEQARIARELHDLVARSRGEAG